ncbi:MAG TPA: hypothetical protein VHG51_05155 [Longimicrobiaceae bacterium]|nr:hypothetical protein [Longimicrobiaceae bacterium]
MFFLGPTPGYWLFPALVLGGARAAPAAVLLLVGTGGRHTRFTADGMTRSGLFGRGTAHHPYSGVIAVRSVQAALDEDGGGALVHPARRARQPGAGPRRGPLRRRAAGPADRPGEAPDRPVTHRPPRYASIRS